MEGSSRNRKGFDLLAVRKNRGDQLRPTNFAGRDLTDVMDR